MKSLKVAKYNIEGCIKPVVIFYTVVLSLLLVMTGVNVIEEGSIRNSGIDVATVIFLFIAGISTFKESFYFSQANNISRKEYFKGIVMHALPLAAVCSIMDIIINRLFNLMSTCPSNYDMIYGTFSKLGFNTWVQSSDVATLFKTFLFQFSLYTLMVLIGLFVGAMYYRCNKKLRVVISVLPIAIIMGINAIALSYPELQMRVIEVIDKIFGISTQNVYSAIITFLCCIFIVISILYLLIRRAVIKER